jgi:hypothetical protein
MQDRWVSNLTSQLIKSVSIGCVDKAHWSCKKCGSNKGTERPKVCDSTIKTLNKERYNKAVIEEYSLTDTSEENLAKYDPDLLSDDLECNQDLDNFFQRKEFYDYPVCGGEEFSWIEESFFPLDTYNNEFSDFWKAFSVSKDKEKAYKNILGSDK